MMAGTKPIRLEDEAPITLADVTVMPSARTIAIGAGSRTIEPRVMQVLVALARRPGQVVGRDALVEACWDGRITGEDAVNRAILKLRRALHEVGSGMTVETVARVGYRLRTPPSLPPPAPAPTRRRPRAWIAGIAGVGTLAAIGLVAHRTGGSPEPARIVVVQPLRAAADDPPARRLSEDLASDLSRAVLGHDGRLEFADAQGGARQAAFALGGSVASIGKDLDAVVTITRRDDAAILWSHEYTVPLAHAAALRQQVGTNVAAVLVCALGTGGLPEPVDAGTLSLYLEACNLHAGDHRREADLLRQVTGRAPRFAGGWTDLAISLSFISRDAPDPAAARREAWASARHALSLDPHQGRAYFALALLLPGLGHWRAREKIIAAGLAADPDCPQLYNARAHDLAAIGRQQDAIAADRRAVALDPLYPGKTAALAQALFDAGRSDEAADTVRHMRESWPDNPYTWSARFDMAARARDPREAEAMLADMPERYLAAGETIAWRAFLRARRESTPEAVRQAIAVARDERRRDGITDAQLIEELTLLGQAPAALDEALRLSAPLDEGLWFRSTLKPLRADPRFLIVARRQGLYAIWRATGLWPDLCRDRSLPYDCRDGRPAAGAIGRLT